VPSGRNAFQVAASFAVQPSPPARGHPAYRGVRRSPIILSENWHQWMFHRASGIDRGRRHSYRRTDVRAGTGIAYACRLVPRDSRRHVLELFQLNVVASAPDGVDPVPVPIVVQPAATATSTGGIVASFGRRRVASMRVRHFIRNEPQVGSPGPSSSYPRCFALIVLASCALAESSQPPPSARMRSTLAVSWRVSRLSACSCACRSAVCEVTTVR
jgi:hypothetical protein